MENEMQTKNRESGIDGNTGSLEWRYRPEDYERLLLSEDMQDFYAAIDNYRQDPSRFNFFEAERTRINLYLSLKHRIVEGKLNRVQVQEMQDYFGGLYDG